MTTQTTTIPARHRERRDRIQLVKLAAAQATPKLVSYQTARWVSRFGKASPQTVQKYCAGLPVTPRSAEAIRAGVARARGKSPDNEALAQFVLGSADVPFTHAPDGVVSSDPAAYRPELAAAFEKHRGNVAQAARELKISRERLRQLIERSPVLKQLRERLLGPDAPSTRADVAHLAGADGAARCGKRLTQCASPEAFARAERKCVPCRLGMIRDAEAARRSQGEP